MVILFVKYQKQIPKARKSRRFVILMITVIISLIKMIQVQTSLMVDIYCRWTRCYPTTSPTNEIAPEITSNFNTPLPQNKSNISFEEHQQFIYRIEARMSALKSHIKCELSTMSSKIDSLSEFVNTKIYNLNNQQKILETLRANNKLLQMEPQTIAILLRTY